MMLRAADGVSFLLGRLGLVQSQIPFTSRVFSTTRSSKYAGHHELLTAAVKEAYAPPRLERLRINIILLPLASWNSGACWNSGAHWNLVNGSAVHVRRRGSSYIT
ncbi:hypothetical protein BJ138DRAFT_457604 [Hygrophoropsis aurantiaca]|uniref:Uncharacterized protein n=1 Tax=Hygrophoropsis aurantiaca TaxID=72124 RepID=A0ACB8A3Q8_9AGAM|nr:hypothetical protein BJ138DRAFT_457604 [Hygrophoropsis aurantiaca]